MVVAVNGFRRALTMASLVLAGESIYGLPYYLRRDYQKPLTRALGLSNTQLGTLSSIFGVLALICYFPGGWLADRVSARKLLSLSLATTAAGGLYLMRFPGYGELFALFAFWGVSTILTFWAALVKATRAWGGHDEQGRAFGILDGGRGLVGAGLASIGLALYATFHDSAAGLRAVITVYTVGTGAAAALVWLFVPEVQAGSAPLDQSAPPDQADCQRPDRGQLGAVLRMPVVWLIALVIFAGYSVYWGTFDLAAFAVDAYGMDEVFGTTLITFGIWLRPGAAVGAGLLADRYTANRVVAVSFALAVASCGYFALGFSHPQSMTLLWVNTAVLCSSSYALRGVFYALLEEGGVPLSLTGTACGVVSILGYTPDIFAPLLSGYLLDAHPGAAGHRQYFSILAVLALIGVGAAIAIRRLGARAEARAQPV